MILITITGTLTGGKALLFEKPRKKGRSRYVPTYSACATHVDTGQRLEFAVTRDSSTQVFGKKLKHPYAEMGECPPCAGTPYHGKVREDGVVGFRVELFEPQYTDLKTLIGQGPVPRKHMQIHFGVAASFGCILVAGPRNLYPRRFARPLQAMLKHTDQIRVMVEPRHSHSKATAK